MICSSIFILFPVLIALGHSTTAKATVTVSTSSKDSNPALLGPTEAYDNQFPFMVSIRRTEFELMYDEAIHICAGVLITEQVVLTAAHCIFDMFGNYVGSRGALTIVAGSRFINGGNSTRIQRRAFKVFVYPSFSRYTREADLAVIILDKGISLEDGLNVNFIDVAQHPSVAGDQCIILGWNNYSITNVSSNVLQYFIVQLYPEDICQLSYGNFSKYLPANQLCTCPAAFDVQNNVCNNSNLCMKSPPIILNQTQSTSSVDNVLRLPALPLPLPTPYPPTIFNNLQWNNRFSPGQNPDSGDPGSILMCNNKITGILAYSHHCADIAGHPQIFTDITEYSDFVNDPTNYLPEMFKFIVHEEGGGFVTGSTKRCEINLSFILTLILINMKNCIFSFQKNC